MALQMSYVDPVTGTEYPESYWELSDFTVEIIHGATDLAQTKVQFEGWYDKAAHDAGLKQFMDKVYELPVAPIDLVPTVGAAIAGLYLYAQATPEPDTGVSFFDGATIV